MTLPRTEAGEGTRLKRGKQANPPRCKKSLSFKQSRQDQEIISPLHTQRFHKKEDGTEANGVKQ